MDKPLTIAQLCRLCEQEMEAGHGDYTIMLSNDDEGNGYHYCWFSFTDTKDISVYGEIDGADEDIAPLDKTIILG